VDYWISKGAQPTDTVRQLIKAAAKTQAAAAAAERLKQFWSALTCQRF
jgi:ribosomal protein S16